MQHWPFPPFFRDAAGDDTLAGAEAIVFTTADETRHGALERFDLQAQLTVLMPHEGAAAITLPFSAIKSIQLMPPIVLTSDEELTRRTRRRAGMRSTPRLAPSPCSSRMANFVVMRESPRG